MPHNPPWETAEPLSSRNGYLSQSERAEAAQLHGCLQKVAKDVQFGQSTLATIEETATDLLAERGWRPDYITVCRRLDLGVPQPGRFGGDFGGGVAGKHASNR
jgi:pantoate--beta-alanine ligase